MKTYIFALALLVAPSLQGLLPPLYEGIKEIEAILNAKELPDKIPAGDVIVRIDKTDEGYDLFTNHHQLQIKVVYTPTGKIGPAEFKLEFGEAFKL